MHSLLTNRPEPVRMCMTKLERISEMADEILEQLPDDEAEVYTLTDENGKDEQFQLIGTLELDGKTYYAMTSVEEESDEYVILRVETEEDDETVLVTIDDDEEFDRVADRFDDILFDEIDYDEETGEN